MRVETAAIRLRRVASSLSQELEYRYRPDQPRAPQGTPEGGQWVDDSVQVAAVPCDGFSGGCQSGGTFGSSGLIKIGDKRLCWDCAIKFLGIEKLPRDEQLKTIKDSIQLTGADAPMTSARNLALEAVRVGDVIFGIAAGGQEKLMLVYGADKDSISARHVTSQTTVEFGRDGRSRHCEGGGSCTILSTAKLPPDDYRVVIALDRKMRTGKAYPDFVLTQDEIQLILTYDRFFKSHPLPRDDGA